MKSDTEKKKASNKVGCFEQITRNHENSEVESQRYRIAKIEIETGAKKRYVGLYDWELMF